MVNAAQRIQTYLKDHGIKQAFIAEKCGWSKQKTSRIINGKYKIAVEEYQVLCKVLGVPYEVFLDSGQD